LATQVLLRLSAITGRDDYRERGETVLRLYYEAMESQPFGFAHLLCALDFSLAKPKEVVIVGRREDPATRELLQKIHSLYLPNLTLQLAAPGQALEAISPLLVGKTQLQGRPTVYVCHDHTCSAPVTDWSELQPLLES
jgi:uncharacterized protein YyaL (SSP411 family)